MDLETGPHKRTVNEDGSNLLEFLLCLNVLLRFAIEILNPGKEALDQRRLGVDLEGPLFPQELGCLRLLLVVGSVWDSSINR